MIDVKTYNASFAKVYRFLEKHINAKTDDDLNAIVSETGQFITSLECDMANAVLNEIERVNSSNK